MKSYLDPEFMNYFRHIPKTIQQQARAKYRLFKIDPFHPGLQFKKVSISEPIYSVRISIDYRALGLWQEDRIDWFWIGTHAEYDNLLNQF